MAFETVRNFHEDAVFEAVTERAGEHPMLGGDSDLLADVACVALNRIPARYIRNKLDMAFYLDEAERARNEAAVRAAVEAAFRFVEDRLVAGSRG